ncbi:MAG TPA: thymidylate kinase [Methanocella sp.]|nr:thymidylate kinase [Methanocella sp.]
MTRFIVIDGLDGSGKDTQALLLKDFLAKNCDQVIVRTHPSQDNFFGTASRKALTKKGGLMRVAATLFYGLDVVRSVLLYCKGDNTVIFVRYLLACAYLPGPIITPVYRLVGSILPMSDEMFFLDVRPQEALRRVKLRGEKEEMFETLSQMEKVCERAKQITGNWIIVDGNGPADEVFLRILKELKR